MNKLQTLVTAGLLVASIDAFAGEAATARLSGGSIDFSPAVAWDSARIAVAGPDGRVSERRVQAGAALAIPASGLADGTYRYRLVLDQQAEPVAGSMVAPKVRGARTLEGHFQVLGGRVVDPASRPQQTR